jgi:hypothetical protein
MRFLLFTILLTLLFNFSFGQSSLLFKTWVDKHGNKFSIHDEQIKHNGLQIYFPIYRYQQKNDTLLLRPLLYKNDSRFKVVLFSIKNLTKDSLILIPLNEIASSLGSHENIITLIDSSLMRNESINL